ncbi:MAG: energy transducer TonB [Pyrinomonadaceae bacterium]
MYAFQRVLPFILTLLVGTALGSLGTFIHTPRDKTTARVLASAPHSCPMHSGIAVTQSNGDSTPVMIRFKPEPRYTEAARRNNTSGTVRLRATFGADGKVSDIETVSALPDGLTEEAVRAAKRIQFTPATFYGEPVSLTKTIEFNFNVY